MIEYSGIHFPGFRVWRLEVAYSVDDQLRAVRRISGIVKIDGQRSDVIGNLLIDLLTIRPPGYRRISKTRRRSMLSGDLIFETVDREEST